MNNNRTRRATYMRHDKAFVEEGEADYEVEAAWESFRQHSACYDDYTRMAGRSWKKYRRAQYRPRPVSIAA